MWGFVTGVDKEKPKRKGTTTLAQDTWTATIATHPHDPENILKRIHAYEDSTPILLAVSSPQSAWDGSLPPETPNRCGIYIFYGTRFYPIRQDSGEQLHFTPYELNTPPSMLVPPSWIVCTKEQFTLNTHGDIEVTLPTKPEVTPFEPEKPMPAATPTKAEHWEIGSVLHSRNGYDQTNADFAIIVRKTDYYVWFIESPIKLWDEGAYHTVVPDERFWKVATTAAQAVNSHYERTKKRLQVGMRRKIITLNNHGDEDIIQDSVYRIYHGWNGLPRHQNWN